MKIDQRMSKKAYIYDKKPTYTEKYLFIWKMTIYVKRDWKRNPFVIVWYGLIFMAHVIFKRRNATQVWKDWRVWKETYIYQNKPTNINNDWETDPFLIFWHDFFLWHTLSPKCTTPHATYVKRDLHAWKETYFNTKRPVKDTNSQILFS